MSTNLYTERRCDSVTAIEFMKKPNRVMCGSMLFHCPNYGAIGFPVKATATQTGQLLLCPIQRHETRNPQVNRSTRVISMLYFLN